jgi:hypothetical protein
MDRRWNKVAILNEPSWRYSGLLFGGPKVSQFSHLGVREAFKEDGCGSARQTIIELTPNGPIKRGTIYTDIWRYGANGVDQRLSGQIENLIARKSFDIVVPQTDVRESYRLIGGRFTGPRASQLRCGLNDKQAGS